MCIDAQHHMGNWDRKTRPWVSVEVQDLGLQLSKEVANLVGFLVDDPKDWRK